MKVCVISQWHFPDCNHARLELHTESPVSHADMCTMCVSAVSTFIINDHISPTWILINRHKLPESDLITNKSPISSASLEVCIEGVN